MAKQNPGPTQYKPTATAQQQVNTAMQQASAAGANSKAAANQQQVNQINAAMKQPTAQQKQNATTTQEALGSAYKVNANGQAPKNLNVGDTVKTNSGSNTVVGINANGTYQMQPTKAQTGGREYTTTNDQQAALDAAVKAVQQGAKNVVQNIQPSIDAANLKAAQDGKKTTPTSSNTPAYAQGYSKNVDYSAEIQKAIAAGNWVQAAALEQLRNAKIDAEGLPYEKTNTFASYYGQVTPEILLQAKGGFVQSFKPNVENPADKMRDLTNQWAEAQQQQVNNQIDFATNQAITEKQRALDDAQPEFQKQLSQLDIDTARAMANSAFYAEARGDRGGIGQSQYNEVQAAALQNKQAIQTARTKLATDTARDIADLRAKGEFEKADKMMTIGQQVLAKLYEIEKLSSDFEISQEQAAYEREMALKNYELQKANITGVLDGEQTLAAQKYDQETAAELAYALIKQGLPVSNELLQAAGLGAYASDATRLANQIAALTGASGGSSSGGGSSSRGGGGGNGNGSEPISGNDDDDDEDKKREPGVVSDSKLFEGIGDGGNGNGGGSNSSNAAYASAAVTAAMRDGKSRSEVNALIDEFYNNGYIDEATAAALRLNNNNRRP